MTPEHTMTGAARLRGALERLLGALDAHAIIIRESHLSEHTIAALDVDDWELIRAAEAGVREALAAVPEAPERDGHEESCASCSGPSACDCGWTDLLRERVEEGTGQR